MQLNAITLGYAVPQDGFEGRVHSSFRSAANLKLDGNEYLLTILLRSETDLPQGIRVDSPQGFTFEDLPINERLTCRGGILRFEKSPLEIDLRKGLRWQSDLSAFSLETTNSMFSESWEKVWQLLNDQQKRSGAEIVAEELLHPQNAQRPDLLKRMVKGVTGLLESTEKMDLNTTDAVSALLGLGSGLTPSGDDLLVGYMAGLFCRSGGNKTRKKFISALGKTLLDLSKNTTDISRTYLYHAAHGQFSRNLTDLAEAICNGLNSDQLYAVATSAMQMGHTSGLDSVTGLLLGLKAWEGLKG